MVAVFDRASATLIAESIGKTQHLTPEGYLLCDGVRIARTGSMMYGSVELPALDAGGQSMLVVDRDAGALFDTHAVSSFSGKPVTLAHPYGMVGPTSWQQDNVGVILNPRRGEGAEAEYLIADLLICQQEAIDAVRAGLREVSCGYDAEYEQVRPGVGRQIKITGNHVALVDRGRCGPSCAIGDKEMAKRSWSDRLRTAFLAKDQKAFDEELEEAQRSGSEGGGGEGAHHPVVVHINQTGVGEKRKEDEEEMGTTDAKTIDALKAVTDGLKTVNDSLKLFDDRLKKVEARDAEEETEAEKKEREKKEKEKEDEKEGTKDSASLAGQWRDVVARAEILAPGGRSGTFDAAAKFKTTDKAICDIRRDALRRASADPQRKAFVDRAFGGGTGYEIDKMTCDAIAPAFIAASEFARDAANGGVYKPVLKTMAGHQPMTAARLQEINMRSRAAAVAVDKK